MKARAELIRAATADGWTVTRTGGDHLKLVHPQASTPVFTGSTPSDHRATQNTLAMMRRALPPEPKPASTPKPKRRAKPQPGKHQIETAIDWQAPEPEPPRPRRPLPGAPRLAMSRWP